MGTIEDMILNSTIGMGKKEFMRTAGLMRNPEGYEKQKRCPVCKKNINTNSQGDMFCEDYNISYEEKGGCFWHRYEDGLNYWSKPEEMFKVMAKKDPKFKKIYENMKSNA